MGSGKWLKRAIKKYGVENFTKEILHVFDTPEAMFEMESILVNDKFITDVSTYNIKVGGAGGWDYINRNCGNQGERLNKSLTNDQRRKGGLNAAKLGIQALTNATIKERRNCPIYDKKFRENCGNAFRGKKHTDETKKKIGTKNSEHQQGDGNSQFGTMWITNDLENKKIKKDGLIPEGWRKGRRIMRR